MATGRGFKRCKRQKGIDSNFVIIKRGTWKFQFIGNVWKRE